jgi:hypothetical protein
VLAYENIVVQLRVRRIHPVDLFHLPRRQVFVRIQAPPALEQPLPAQDFVDARDTAVEVVGDVEERSVGVGDLARDG